MKNTIFIKIISPIFLLIFLITKITVLTGCANQIPPTGGDRDSLPPLLLKVTPPDSSKGFTAKTITFTFDEFIDQPQEIFKNLIVSPMYSTMPSVEHKLRTLTVRIKDTLEPNTTYYYNFGDAIKDVNEGNILHNFSYIFTTGDILDTLQLGGNVLVAETGGIDSTLTVMLHRSGEDSAVIKERPRYITRVDGKGNFRFQYLPAGVYYIYALKDDNNTRMYSSSQLFAFADSAVEVKIDARPVTLYAFTEKKDQPGGATVSISGINRGGGRNDDKRLKFTSNLSGNQQDLLGNFSLNFERPLRNLDTTKLQLSTDSTFNYAPSNWELDSLKKKLTLKIDWKENTRYNLILDKDFAEDTLGRKLLKTDTLHFTTKKQADYGSVKVSFLNIDLSQNPVLQFSQNGQVIKTYPVITTEVYDQLFNPGEYELSILYDKNKNGHWDTGQFFGEKRQPELVRPLNKKVTIRPNWDNEFEVRL
jgi:hypothetical protein